ncbi:hypothetical protein [Nocardia arthritidis]|uniref:Uncharacterized protein n=1 Tax=Nocardia arthritidis TaxID=228602 RepID=A0A6G9YTT7_9NOCA|nr:hypothetical protein [Nocardia arthritidis]QIS16628.1 hypothetical protein F5544_44125 [Nocardia arthritidis]
MGATAATARTPALNVMPRPAPATNAMSPSAATAKYDARGPRTHAEAASPPR